MNERRRDRLAAGVAAGLVAAAALRLYAQTRHYGLVGWDSYPLVLAARVRSLSDLPGLVCERMLSETVVADWYRPLLQATLALDYALFGLEPAGYQATSVLAFAACAGALFWTARQLGIGGPGALVATALFLVHPLLFEVLPVVARRPDLLCCLFLLAALGAQVRAVRRGDARLPLLPAAFAGLAMLSKEPGFLAPAFAPVAVALYDRRAPWRARGARAARALVPHAGVLAGAFALRSAVLGGVTGQRPAPFAEGLLGLPQALAWTLREVVLPPPALHGSTLARGVALALAASVALALLFARGRPRADDDDLRLRAFGAGCAWVVLVSFLYGVGGMWQAWYALIPSAGAAIALGAAAEALLAALLRSRGPARALAALALAPLVAFALLHASVSPLFHRYDDWERVTMHTARYLETLDELVRVTRDGRAVRLRRPRAQVRGRPGDPHVRSAMVLQPYTLEAWAELTHPERTIRVVEASDPRAERASPGELVLVLEWPGARGGSGGDAPTERKPGDP